MSLGLDASDEASGVKRIPRMDSAFPHDDAIYGFTSGVLSTSRPWRVLFCLQKGRCIALGEGRTSLPAKPARKRCVLRQAMGEVNLRRGWAGGSLGPTPVKVNPANRLLLLMPYDRRPLLAASRHIKDDLHAAKTRLRVAPGYLIFAEHDAVL